MTDKRGQDHEPESNDPDTDEPELDSTPAVLRRYTPTPGQRRQVRDARAVLASPGLQRLWSGQSRLAEQLAQLAGLSCRAAAQPGAPLSWRSTWR